MPWPIMIWKSLLEQGQDPAMVHTSSMKSKYEGYLFWHKELVVSELHQYEISHVER